MVNHLVILLFLVTAVSCEKVLERHVEEITFRGDQFTTFRRTEAHPQIKCVGLYCKEAPPQKEITCRHLQPGKWECEGFPAFEHHAFGRTDVNCEGYDSKDDPYILDGSCYVEYTLNRISKPIYNPPSDAFFDVHGYTIIGFGLAFVLCIILYAFNCFDETAPAPTVSGSTTAGAVVGVLAGAALASRGQSRPRSSHAPAAAVASFGRFGGNRGFGSSSRR